MKFGATFLARPPVTRLVDLAVRAEEAGFDYVFLNDCDTLFEDPWPVFSLIASETRSVHFGPCVTNPVTRDWSVLAGMVATLNEYSEGRLICGIGRGDAAVRTIGRPPATVAEFEQCITSLRELLRGRESVIDGHPVHLKWVQPGEVEMWGAGYGPRALAAIGRTCDGCLIQAADPSLLAWARGVVDAAAAESGRDPADVRMIAGAPAYVGDDLAHAHDQVRWFGASVANHIARLAALPNAAVPEDITAIARGREGYDYGMKGTVGTANDAFVTDELNLRLTLLGPAADHIAKLRSLAALGTDAYTIYLNHDAVEHTIDAYGRDVIPVLRDTAATPRSPA